MKNIEISQEYQPNLPHILCDMHQIKQDHDIVKSSLLHSHEGIPMDPKLAGKISYNIDWSLIEFQLSQGNNVIFDSPCLYDKMIEKGTDLAKKYKVKYKYVECYLDDMNEINRRLKNRNRMISQIEEIKSVDAFKLTIANSKKPSNTKTLLVNTKEPIEGYIQKVIDYLNE